MDEKVNVKYKQKQKEWLNIFYFCLLLVVGAAIMIGLVELLIIACEYDLSLKH
jgi:hypothetical protein